MQRMIGYSQADGRKRIIRVPSGGVGVMTTGEIWRLTFAGITLHTACDTTCVPYGRMRITSGTFGGTFDATDTTPSASGCGFTTTTAGPTFERYGDASCAVLVSTTSGFTISVTFNTLTNANYVRIQVQKAVPGVNRAGVFLFDAWIPLCDAAEGVEFDNDLTAAGCYSKAAAFGGLDPGFALGYGGTVSFVRVCP